MEKLLRSVKDAEAQATEQKQKAQARAAELVNNAQLEAAELVKNEEASLKAYRETTVKEASQRIAGQTERTLQEKRAEAEAEAAALLSGTKSAVAQIVRRIQDGDSRHA